MDFKQKDKLLKNRENNEILFHSIVGSQNYDLDSKNSDIDTKAVVLLDFNDIIGKKTYSKEIKWQEDDTITSLKDLEEYKRLLVKSNINILETLFAKEYSYNKVFEDEIKELLDNREKIAKMNLNRLFRSERGIAYSIYNKNKKFNDNKYSKDSYHILKTENFFNNYFIENKTFEESIKQHPNKEIILKIKSKDIEVKEANNILTQSMLNINKISDKIQKKLSKGIETGTEEWLNEWIIKVYKKHLKI